MVRDGTKIIVAFPQETFFDKGQVKVKKTSEILLRNFAQKYIQFAGTHQLSIKAFTDTTPVRQVYRYQDNLELSALRAVAAMRVLQHAGIPLDRMKISGQGEYMLRAPASHDQKEKLKQDALARKIILVIEPMTEEKL